MAARTGDLLTGATTLGLLRTMYFEAAFYRQGARLRTGAEREAAVAGWLVSSYNVPAVISSAIGPEPSLDIRLYHVNPGARPALVGQYSGTAGTLPLTTTTRMNVDGQWLVIVRGSPITHGLPGTAQGILVFVGGTAVSLLLFLTLSVLGRSRERALELVAEKTSQLQHQAVHDPLTGLANRVLAVETADQMLARARRSGVPVAALYIDLDGFKQINDTFGHAAGDGLLRTCAQRLRSTVRAGDTAARLSGDEFLVLVEGATLDGGPDIVAERLLEALNQPYDLTTEAGRRVAVTVSIGVAHGQRATAEELIADADVALYAAKEGGRSRYVVFTDGMRNPGEQRVSLQTDLAGALEADELSLAYQPIFDLRAERTIGVEALMRWRHPVRGMIAPDVFIPIAEESGLIIPIGRWVLETACRQAARWRAEGHPLGVAVNISTRQLESPQLIGDLRHALSVAGLEPEALTIEITETRLMRDPRASAQRLARIKELGIRVAIDDFGTGYSSLAYLRQFPVDTLKIDRSFVQGAAASRQSAALLRMLIRLGKSLGLETLGEGIESQEQLAHLQQEHCDTGQGYMFGRPVDAEALSEFLTEPRTPVAGSA
jgi:diguanylate cyclase (GGDEF)-like protein